MNYQLESENKAKYCEDPNYSGIFKFVISGIVNRNDILGTLYKKTNTLGHEYSLSTLNTKKKLGLINITIFTDTRNNETTGEIKLPLKVSQQTACLVCATVETIDKVGAYKSIFRFKDFEQESANTVVKIVTRAKQIYETKLLKYKQGISEIISSLFSTVSKMQLKEISSGLWVGPKFSEATEIILVEGRADVLNLCRAGIYNTLSVNGLNTPSDFNKYVQSKSLICMFDRDRGGQTILYNLCKKLKIDEYIQLEETNKVQEISKYKILSLLNSKKIFDAEKYKIYYEEKYLKNNK